MIWSFNKYKVLLKEKIDGRVQFQHVECLYTIRVTHEEVCVSKTVEFRMEFESSCVAQKPLVWHQRPCFFISMSNLIIFFIGQAGLLKPPI
jgi:hypothetical protein